MTDTSFALAELRSLGEAVEGGVVVPLGAASLDDAHARIVSLRDALRRRDTNTVVSLADALRGASANAGAAQVALLCGALGSDAAAGHLATADDLVDAIDREIGRAHPGW
jgi:HPt (histidine-containing phosphotransfer) domain-containing protein